MRRLGDVRHASRQRGRRSREQGSQRVMPGRAAGAPLPGRGASSLVPLPVVRRLGGTVLFPILKAMHMSLYNHVLIKPQEYRYRRARQLRSPAARRRLLAEPQELVLLGLRLRLPPVPGRVRRRAPAP